MLLSVFGTPSALTYAGCTIIRAIADAAAGSHAFIQAVFVDDLRNAWMKVDRSKTSAIVLFSDFPSTPLVELIRANRAPIILFLDEFSEIVRHSLETREMSTPHALRFASQSVCALDQLKDQEPFIITPKRCRQSIGNFVFAVCEFFRIKEPRNTAANVLARLGYDGDGPTLGEYFFKNRPRLVSEQAAVMHDNSRDGALIKHVADQYAGIVAGNKQREIIWPPELFLDWDRTDAFLSGPIDLLGAARFVICGPYLHLTIGEWTAHIVIEIAENLSGNRLGVDVFSGQILCAIATEMPTSGIFKFTMGFRVEDPFLPVELRFQIMTGAIEGKLMLHEVTFRNVEKKDH